MLLYHSVRFKLEDFHLVLEAALLESRSPQESRDTTHLQNDPEKTWATVLDTLETKQSTMAQCGRYYLLSEPTHKYCPPVSKGSRNLVFLPVQMDVP